MLAARGSSIDVSGRLVVDWMIGRWDSGRRWACFRARLQSVQNRVRDGVARLAGRPGVEFVECAGRFFYPHAGARVRLRVVASARLLALMLVSWWCLPRLLPASLHSEPTLAKALRASRISRSRAPLSICVIEAAVVDIHNGVACLVKDAGVLRCHG